jgi:hypothetical protein
LALAAEWAQVLEEELGWVLELVLEESVEESVEELEAALEVLGCRNRHCSGKR